MGAWWPPRSSKPLWVVNPARLGSIPCLSAHPSLRDLAGSCLAARDSAEPANPAIQPCAGSRSYGGARLPDHLPPEGLDSSCLNYGWRTKT